MSGRRKKPATFVNATATLDRIEQMHRHIMQEKAELRTGTPHHDALDRLGEDLRRAWCALAGVDRPSWSEIGTRPPPPGPV